MDDKSIKHTIRSRRKELGLTQNKMAEMLGIDERTYKLIESEQGTKMVYPRMEEIARALDLSLSALIGDKEETDPALLKDERTQAETLVADLRMELAEKDALIDRLRTEIDRLNGCIDDKDFVNRHLREELARLNERS